MLNVEILIKPVEEELPPIAIVSSVEFAVNWNDMIVLVDTYNGKGCELCKTVP